MSTEVVEVVRGLENICEFDESPKRGAQYLIPYSLLNWHRVESKARIKIAICTIARNGTAKSTGRQRLAEISSCSSKI